MQAAESVTTKRATRPVRARRRRFAGAAGRSRLLFMGLIVRLLVRGKEETGMPRGTAYESVQIHEQAGKETRHEGEGQKRAAPEQKAQAGHG